MPFLRTLEKGRYEGLKNTSYAILRILISYFLAFRLIKREILYRSLSKGVVVEVNGFKMYLDLRDEGICRDLFLHRIREPFSTDYLMNSGILTKGNIVLDIGANIGYYVLMESALVGNSGKVYAVEPVLSNITILKRNIKLNECENVEIFRLAMGDENKKSRIYISSRCNCSAMRKDAVGGRIMREENVKVVTVDSFLKNRDTPDLIRMDVEGYEYNIMKGMKETLKKDVKILMEVHGDLLTGRRTEEIFKTLKENGFKIQFAVRDRTCGSKIAEQLMYKLDKMKDAEFLCKDMDRLQKCLIRQKMVAHICFQKS